MDTVLYSPAITDETHVLAPCSALQNISICFPLLVGNAKPTMRLSSPLLRPAPSLRSCNVVSYHDDNGPWNVEKIWRPAVPFSISDCIHIRVSISISISISPRPRRRPRGQENPYPVRCCKPVTRDTSLPSASACFPSTTTQMAALRHLRPLRRF